MADFLGKGSVDSALGGVTATQYLSGQALSGLEPAESESGLSSSESVLNILKLIFAGAPLSEVLTIIARLVECR
jgi:formate hydrogenlyase transcriptional activator